MNIYRFTFCAACPVNGVPIDYSVEIHSEKTIRVELLLAWRELQKSGIHEDFADRLSENFGGEQYVRAVHHGVQIETLRP